MCRELAEFRVLLKALMRTTVLGHSQNSHFCLRPATQAIFPPSRSCAQSCYNNTPLFSTLSCLDEGSELAMDPCKDERPRLQRRAHQFADVRGGDQGFEHIPEHARTRETQLCYVLVRLNQLWHTAINVGSLRHSHNISPGRPIIGPLES